MKFNLHTYIKNNLYKNSNFNESLENLIHN